GVTSAIQEGVTPSVVDMMVEMRKQTSLDDTNVSESFPSLSTLVTTMPSNALGRSSYANITGKPSGKKVNVRTLFTPERNGIDVIVLVYFIRAISERFNNPLILKKWHPNENLLKKDVTTVLVWVKLHGVLVTAFSEDGLSAIATKLGVRLVRFLDIFMRNVQRIQPTVSSSGNKKKGVKPTIEVSNSNQFDVLISVNNDVEFGTNGGTTNLINYGATLSGSSFINVDNSSSDNTSIIDKIEKFKDLLTSGQAILVDKAGNPLKKVEFMGEYDSEDEVASIDNDMARSMASERVGFGTQSLLKQ
nr:hypothetical protein [Tanacetum cinerariifolium]